jgi:hypothetical protein
VSYLYRRIFKTQLTGSAVIRELLQTMFVGDMLRPGSDAWIVSPWVSNVVLLDNRSGDFDALNPEWGRREVRLNDVLLSLLTRGRRVTVITRDEEPSRKFLRDLQELADQHLLTDQLEVVVRDRLHTKGILLTDALLLGSMNLTYSGLQINDEWIEYSRDTEDIARARMEFATYCRIEA